MPATTEAPKTAETPQALPRIAFASAGAMTPQARRRAAELAHAEQPQLSAAGEIARGLRPAEDHVAVRSEPAEPVQPLDHVPMFPPVESARRGVVARLRDLISTK